MEQVGMHNWSGSTASGSQPLISVDKMYFLALFIDYVY